MIGHCPASTRPDMVVVDVLGLAGTGQDKRKATRMLDPPVEERIQHVVRVPEPAVEPQPGPPGCSGTKRSDDRLNE